MISRLRWIAIAFSLSAIAAAPPDLHDLAAKAAKRFPQPVQVAALIGRDVLKPVESQPVLGHVVAITRRADGGLDLVMDVGGVLGLGEHSVAVPIEAVALLGQYVALIDYTPEQLALLPASDPAAPKLADSDTISVGIVRPFH